MHSTKQWNFSHPKNRTGEDRDSYLNANNEIPLERTKSKKCQVSNASCVPWYTTLRICGKSI